MNNLKKNSINKGPNFIAHAWRMRPIYVAATFARRRARNLLLFQENSIIKKKYNGQ